VFEAASNDLTFGAPSRYRPRLDLSFYPTPTAKRKATFIFAYQMGVQGNVISLGVNELIIPNYN
jgi:hypothetical protein